MSETLSSFLAFLGLAVGVVTMGLSAFVVCCDIELPATVERSGGRGADCARTVETELYEADCNIGDCGTCAAAMGKIEGLGTGWGSTTGDSHGIAGTADIPAKLYMGGTSRAAV